MRQNITFAKEFAAEDLSISYTQQSKIKVINFTEVK